MNNMKHKILLTLALLITAVGGAWAQDPVDGTIAWPVGNEASATVSASIKDAISNTGVTTGSGLTVVTATYFDTEMVSYKPSTSNAGNVSGVMIEYTIEAVDGYKFKPTGVDYAAVKVGADIASYSWSYTIDGVESAITDVSKDDVLRNTGSNSGTAQLMHSESITADGCSVFTLRFYISNCGNTKNICIGNITISGSVSAAPEPDVEVTTNAAEEGATFTEASFAMPAFDATAEYELVRDITQGVDVEVRIDGAATERIRIAKDTEGYYQFVTKQYWQFAAVDKLDNNKDLTNGEMIYSFKKKVDDDYEAVDTRYDLCPGTWRLQAEANPEKPYDGIAYGSDILLYDFKEITFPKGYSTHYYNESLVLDEICNSLKFYAVTAVTSEKVTLTEITSKAIPAQTPFIVYNETPEPITAVMGMLMADVVTSAEQFKGTAEDKNMGSQSNCYILRNGDSTPTFRLVKGAGTLPAHRCYIDLGAAAGTRTLGFDFGDGTTGIDSVESGELKVDSYYDLQGRKRQGTPQRKGVYVKAGRKEIVK